MTSRQYQRHERTESWVFGHVQIVRLIIIGIILIVMLAIIMV